jgi:hypothetical protein
MQLGICLLFHLINSQNNDALHLSIKLHGICDLKYRVLASFLKIFNMELNTL